MYWNCCPNCGNIYGLTSGANSKCYCPKCDSFFSANTVNSNFSTASIENNITVRIPTAANAAKGFYYTDKHGMEVSQSEGDSITINAKSITINDGKISVTIDKDGIDKFWAIEVNGVKFVQSDVEDSIDEISHEYNQLVEKIYDAGLEKQLFEEEME